MSDDVERAVESIRRGGLAVIPTDTVYGLVCSAFDEEAFRRLTALKGRPPGQPTALVAASVEELLACVPELAGRATRSAGALLPGPYTLVLPNPAGRFAWLCGSSPHTIGVRVPAVEGPGREVLLAAGPVAATSANLAGGKDPRRAADIPPEVRAAAAVVDGGELPGTPSTVVDLTQPKPRILREGAGDPAEALRRVAEADGSPAS